MFLMANILACGSPMDLLTELSTCDATMDLLIQLSVHFPGY